MTALILVIMVSAAMLAVTVRSLFVRAVPVQPPPARAQTAPPPPPPPAPLPAAPISIAGAAIKGSPTARVAIVGYSDFQCPYCVRFATTVLSALEKDYFETGKAFYAFKHLPMAALHAHAVKMAEASECAARQGKFWPMHDRLFAAPKDGDPQVLVAHADALGLERTAFAVCLDGQMSQRVQADVIEGNRLGVTGTPTFFIGLVQDVGVKVTERLIGAQPATRFAAVLDAALDRVQNGDR